MRRKIVAAFDFDGTLTYFDTLFPFLCSTLGIFNTLIRLIPISFKLLSFPLGGLGRQDAKEMILSQTLKGYPLPEIENKADAFAKGPLLKLLKPQGIKRLAWHQAQGHQIVLISANIEPIIQAYAKQIHADYVIASKLEVSQKGVTGKLQGLNCWGEEKVRRLLNTIGPKKDYELYVYGDSKGDAELLQLADHPYYRTFS